MAKGRTTYARQSLVELLAKKGLKGLTRGQRISAVKQHLVPPVRSERERQLRARYGMLLEDYDNLLNQQNGACAACKKRWPHGNLYVDHDHRSGHVRGLLCAGCNSIAGLIDSENIWAVWGYIHEDWLKQQITLADTEEETDQLALFGPTDILYEGVGD